MASEHILVDQETYDKIMKDATEEREKVKMLKNDDNKCNDENISNKTHDGCESESETEFDVSDIYDTNYILSHFTGEDLDYVRKILSIIFDPESDVIQWDIETGEISFEGKRKMGSNIIEILKLI